jgi:CheY-like chemotaxis protein
MRILVVEDERKVASFIRQGLAEEGYAVDVATRVRVLLRRRAGQRTPVLQLADLRLDPATRQVTRGVRTIALTAREYALLEYFLRSAGRVLTRPMLAEHVWGIDFDPESNVIDVYVGYLRRKIDLPGEVRDTSCGWRRESTGEGAGPPRATDALVRGRVDPGGGEPFHDPAASFLRKISSGSHRPLIFGVHARGQIGATPRRPACRRPGAPEHTRRRESDD